MQCPLFSFILIILRKEFYSKFVFTNINKNKFINVMCKLALLLKTKLTPPLMCYFVKEATICDLRNIGLKFSE